MLTTHGGADGSRVALRVVLVDHQTLFADALAAAITGQSSMQVVANVSNSDDGFRVLKEHRPEVAVLSAGLPGRSAFDVVTALSKRGLSTRFLYRFERHSDITVEQAVESRGAGIVTLSESLSSFLEALRVVGDGGLFVSKCLDSLVYIDERQRCLRMRRRSRMSVLTPRQIEVLRYLALGLSVKEVARRMHLSEKSVDSHKYRIMHRLDIHDRVELARLAIREGLSEP